MNKYKIENNVILVTGAAGQLGQSIVNNALKCDAKVACLDLSLESLEDASRKNSWTENVNLYKVDITKEHSISKIFIKILNDFGKIDSLVNNAGISVFDPWYNRTEADFNKVMNVNLKGPFSV